MRAMASILSALALAALLSSCAANHVDSNIVSFADGTTVLRLLQDDHGQLAVFELRVGDISFVGNLDHGSFVSFV